MNDCLLFERPVVYYRVFLLFLMLAGSSEQIRAQKFIESYYKYNWQETTGKDEASFYAYAEQTDSGWYRKDYFLCSKSSKIQMVGLYEDKENKMKNGVFRWYYPNGNLKTFGKYIHNQKEGLWINWYSDGTVEDSAVYKNGHYSGIAKSWYKNGYLQDSLNMSDAGNGVYVAWFDNGMPSEAGKYANYKKQGRWVYYHRTGKISSVELYRNDSLQNFQLFAEDGTPQDDSIVPSAVASFPKGRKGWNNYVQSSLHYPTNLYVLNGDHVTVVTEAVINENGEIEDAEVTVPYYDVFDKEALRVIKTSPKWIPAVEHNRKVKYHFTFAVEFGQRFD